LQERKEKLLFAEDVWALTGRWISLAPPPMVRPRLEERAAKTIHPERAEVYK
jgi:hypothetical protein